MSGGEPSSIKRIAACAVRVPYLSWLRVLRIEYVFDVGCAVLPWVELIFVKKEPFWLFFLCSFGGCSLKPKSQAEYCLNFLRYFGEYATIFFRPNTIYCVALRFLPQYFLFCVHYFGLTAAFFTGIIDWHTTYSIIFLINIQYIERECLHEDYQAKWI